MNSDLKVGVCFTVLMSTTNLLSATYSWAVIACQSASKDCPTSSECASDAVARRVHQLSVDDMYRPTSASAAEHASIAH